MGGLWNDAKAQRKLMRRIVKRVCVQGNGGDDAALGLPHRPGPQAKWVNRSFGRLTPWPWHFVQKGMRFGQA